MRDLFTRDFHWKAFSILMAIGIWLTVHRISGEPEPRTIGGPSIVYSLPVLAVSSGADVHTVELGPKIVDATISGSPDVMNSIQPGQIHAFVNLTGITSAENLPRDVEISLPRGATVVHIDPPQVTVTIPKQE